MFKFKTKISNEHSFKTFIKDKHNFIINALNATIFREIETINEYNFKVHIGGRRIELDEMEDRLKNLSPSLRQLVGAYVYIKAKMRINEVVVYSEKVSTNAISKLRLENTYRIVEEVLTKIKAKMKLENDYSSSLNIKIIFGQKLRLTNNYIYKTSAKYSVKMKTKISLLYKSSCSIQSRIKAKLKLSSIQSSLTTTKAFIEAKAKTNDNIYKQNIEFIELLKAKARVTTLYKSGVNLSGSVTRVLVKMRFSENNINTVTMRFDRALSKLKIDTKNKTSDELSFDYQQCKKLIDFEAIDLKDTPTSLFDFCYGNPSNTWRSLMGAHSSWRNVKDSYTTWGDLVNRKPRYKNNEEEIKKDREIDK